MSSFEEQNVLSKHTTPVNTVMYKLLCQQESALFKCSASLNNWVSTSSRGAALSSSCTLASTQMKAREGRMSLRGLVKYHFIINLVWEVHLRETKVWLTVVRQGGQKKIRLINCQGSEHPELFLCSSFCLPLSAVVLSTFSTNLWSFQSSLNSYTWH